MEDFDEGFKCIDIPKECAIAQEAFVSMVVFNYHLHVGTAQAGGFSMWKIRNSQSGNWKLVVDQGAGDALNE